MKKLIFSILSLLALSLQAQQVIPLVSHQELHEGTYTLPNHFTLSAPKNLKATAQAFLDELAEQTDIQGEMKDRKGQIQLLLSPLSTGEYRLEIKQKDIRILANDTEGFNHGLATLHQLLLKGQTLKQQTITDAPRLGYRGLMIDCSRHFWTVAELEKTIDAMQLFKLNKLHLHLTDNQGWRFEVQKYPQLTEKGTYFWDYPALSGKYYKQKELKHLVEYALTRGIEIIPEVDMPGHMLSLLAAFPELSCVDEEFEPFPNERDGQYRKNTWMNMVCMGNPKTYEILEDIIQELCEVFPSKNIHLGGDEVSVKLWENCPHCLELMKQHNLTKPIELQDLFTQWCHDQLQKRGRTLYGWDEINSRSAAQKGDVISIWHSDPQTLEKAINDGLQVVMCPGDPCYFDYSYAKNPTRKVYEWDPIPTTLKGKEAQILGAQANLWTEYVANQQDLEKMLYPRLCALAEVLWTQPSQKNWHDFYQRVHAFPFQQLDIHSWNQEKETDAWFNTALYQKPVLPAGTHVETNIYNVAGYDPEFALDGDYTTFFQNGWGTDASEYFKVWYDTPQAISQVRVICDASKDYLQYANLYISEDDSTFTLAGKSDDRGNFTVNLDGRRIKSFKIVPTFPSLSRLVIREIEVDKFDFSVLNWNIWQEGTMIKDGYQAIIEELVRLKPDFVTFAEVRNYRDDFLARLCNDLKARGLTYYSFRSDDSGMISHYPILEHNTVFPLKDDHGSVYRLLAQVPDAQGKMREVAVYCTHLDYLNDTYYEVRAYDGSTWKKMDAPLTDVPEILRRNDLSQRDEAIMAFIQEAKKDMEKGRAVVLGGDFNEPSWQDWTEETKELFDHHGVIVPWPQTTRLHQAGFADCFRTIYPDPVKYPGITYPCDNPIAPMKELSWAPESDERERIDLMFFTPNTLQVNSCRVFGPLGDVKRAQRVPGMGQAYTITPKGIWPTDHRGILSTFMFLDLGSTK